MPQAIPRRRNSSSLSSNSSASNKSFKFTALDAGQRKSPYPHFPDESRIGKRYCCGFFTSRSFCILFFVFFGLLFLSGLTAAAFFLFPRAPKIFFNMDQRALIENVKLSSSPSPSAPTAPIDILPVSAAFNLNLTVFSPNYVAYSFDNILITANLLDPASSGKKIGGMAGSGSSHEVTFAAFQNTTLTIPFLFLLNVSRYQLETGEDPVTKVLLQQCAHSKNPSLPQSSSQGFIKVAANAQIFSHWIDWLGVRPSFDETLFLPCPSAIKELGLS